MKRVWEPQEYTGEDQFRVRPTLLSNKSSAFNVRLCDVFIGSLCQRNLDHLVHKYTLIELLP